jgi:N-acetylglucosaminyldiphosphoundecaprenol N-acetyl-beta-D-mannosaminyltransferase
MMTEHRAIARFEILGVPLHAVDMALAKRLLKSFLAGDIERQLMTVNIDFLALATSDEAFRKVILSSDLTVLDGRPLLWMARYLGLHECERITGPDLIEAAAALSAESGARIFLLGGSPAAAYGTRKYLENRFPGVQICGVLAPPPASFPFPAEVDEEICKTVHEAKADILFVAFGAPKQDLWIQEHLGRLGVKVSVGIGGSFNFLSKLTPRAPRILQRLGLEWAFRLCIEPTRLWKRYLLKDMPFLVSVIATELASMLSLRKRPRSLKQVTPRLVQP